MSRPSPTLAVSGAAMDVRVPKRRGKRAGIAIGAAALALAAAVLLWDRMPRGLQVAGADVNSAAVEKGTFRDDVLVRARAEPLHSVILDSVESGRVEEVMAKDGAAVQQGQLLFRLSNPQRHLELLARQAEHAQQISNLSNLRVSQQSSKSMHERRLSELMFAYRQREKQNARNQALAARGFISSGALEESNDALAQDRHALAQERASTAHEVQIERDALRQMQDAVKGLESGLQLVHGTVAALAVRAPAAGRLTGFRLQVGQTVKIDEHIGRIDDPAAFKLTAQVDEFYLNRFALGRQGQVRQGERVFPVEVSAIFPQIKDGRFSVELIFTKAQPESMSPGQSFDAQLTLGEPAPALLLPNGAFVNDSGGAWVFVIGADGASAVRRAIRVGRRNNSQIEVLSGLAPGERVIVSSYAAFGKAERLRLTQ